MKSRMVVALVAGLLWASARAADPWIAKAPAEWTMADTSKVLVNSPWVRDARVPAPWLSGTPTVVFPALMACGGRMDQDAMPATTNMAESFQSIVIFRVSWVSSRAYREAKARRSVLCGETEQDDVDSLIDSGAAEDYVLQVESPDMAPYEGSDEESIRKNTTLTGKKSGLAIAPTKVQLRKIAGGRIFDVYYHFPKANEDGTPVVVPGESELALSYKSGKTEIKVRFLPPKMKLGTESDF